VPVENEQMMFAVLCSCDEEVLKYRLCPSLYAPMAMARAVLLGTLKDSKQFDIGAIQAAATILHPERALLIRREVAGHEG
jgi:hypothetical protein